MPSEIYIIRFQEKKIESEPGFEVRDSNPGLGSIFSLEI